MLAAYIAGIASSPLKDWAMLPPWTITSEAAAIVGRLLAALDGTEFLRRDGSAIHRGAIVEAGAVVKEPAIVGPGCFVAAGAYLRGGVWLDAGVSLGPGVELKSSFVFARTRLAHFNFVGDSMLGAEVNLEAGGVIANHRNERADKQIRIRLDGQFVAAGVEKFGALVGDRAQIGANAVLAPGSVISPGQIVPRLALVDHEATDASGQFGARPQLFG